MPTRGRCWSRIGRSVWKPRRGFAISTFDRLKADPKIGSAEVRRQATLANLNDASSPL
jgi:hypothetical protein